MTFDYKNIKIMGSNNETVVNEVLQAPEKLAKVDIATGKKNKKEKPKYKIITKDDREEGLNNLIESINEVDEDTNKLKMTQKEGANAIVEFIKDYYLMEKKLLKI